MTWWMALSGGIVLLFGLLLLGVPIFVAFLILNVTGILVLLGPSGFGMFANSIFTTGTLNALAAVPLFILMGDILFRSGAIEVLLDSMDRLVGRIRGRQYVLCILLSAVLGALSGAATKLAEVVVEMKLSHWMMLAVLLALPFLLELMCLDATALMFILIPIYQPILKIYGFDPIWFYTLFLVVVTVGGITPPFGYTLFALKTAAPNVPMTDIFKASWPFTWIILLGLVVMAIFPDIITFLPNLTPSR